MPALQNRYVTFASMNNLVKVNVEVINVWSTLLRVVPESRLLIATNGGRRARAHVADAFKRHGIAMARIELIDRVPYEKYFEFYKRADIALDTFPYNGGTTTLDALWMGVPVITLAGAMPVGRAGVSILSNLGLKDLIAHSIEDYVRAARRLASDLPALRALRSTLRQRLIASPIMNCREFTCGLEDAYRIMWNEWLAAEQTI